MKKSTPFVLGAVFGLVSSSLSFSVSADETVKSFPAGGASDILNRPEKEPVGDAGGAIVKKADCRLNNGRVVRAEDADYAQCMEMKGGGAKAADKKAKKGVH